jgi:hypothetical protein
VIIPGSDGSCGVTDVLFFFDPATCRGPVSTKRSERPMRSLGLFGQWQEDAGTCIMCTIH